MATKLEMAMLAGIALMTAVQGAEQQAATTTDWNQWRGPNRNGIAPNSPKLADAWGPTGPVLVWKSEEKIVGGCNKGKWTNYAQPVVAKGRVYLYVHDMAAAADLIYCLDANTGKTLWKTSYPGNPDGSCSSTPCVVHGKVYVVGTMGMYCLDAETGEEDWRAPSLVLNSKGDGINSSPAIVDGVLVVIAGSGKHLNPGVKDQQKESGVIKGFDPATGKELWSCPQATADANLNGDTSTSVAVWNTAKGPCVITGMGKLTCVKPKDGSVIWQDGRPIAGSTSTPSILADVCVLGQEIKAYRLGPNKAEELFPGKKGGGRVESYLLHDDHIYAFCYGVYKCFDLTGKVLWQKTFEGKCTSPVLADGKVFHSVGGEKAGAKGKLVMFSATPTLPAFFTVDSTALHYASPALCGGKLFLRLEDGVACYDLAKLPADAVIPSEDPAPAAAPAAKGLITFVDVSPAYFAQRKGITDQSAWPPEKEQEAATLNWALNKPLDADGWIDLIALQDSRGELTSDCVAYARVVLEAKAAGKLALALTRNKAVGDVGAIVVWVNGKNVLRQDTHNESPEHEELIVDLAAGNNILLVRTAPTRGHNWKLQVQAKPLDGLAVKQVPAGVQGIQVASPQGAQ